MHGVYFLLDDSDERESGVCIYDVGSQWLLFEVHEG